MTHRVEPEEVKEIIDTDIENEGIHAFIKAANLTVTYHLGGEGLDAELLKEIERWFSAHLVAIRQKQVAREGLDDHDVTYGGKTAMGLQFTAYGQQVLILDPTGKMAAVDERRKSATVENILGD